MKHTEIGSIPEDWDIFSLADISDIKTGPFGSALHESDYVLDGTPIITVEHLAESGIEHRNLPLVSDKDKKRLSSYILLENDIVFSRVGSVDRNSIVTDKEQGWLFSGRLLRIRIKTKTIDAKYLSFFFHQEVFKQRVRSVAVGQTMASLNTQLLKSLSFSAPPLSEQQAIADALNDADRWIESLEVLLQKKCLIKQGAVQELLRPQDGWKVLRLGEIAEIYTGKRNNQDKVEDGLYPFFVRSQNVERINSYSFNGEAILIPGEGNIGKIFHYINGKFDFHQRVYKISDFKDASGKYIFYYLRQKFGAHALQNSVKATVDSLRLPTFQEFEIPLPNAGEQKRIAEILSDMDCDIEVLEQKLSKARQIKQGMMQQLLTGQIRLIKSTSAKAIKTSKRATA